jgi:hypothetical protein
MRPIREVVAVVLAMASLLMVPPGILFLIAGLSGILTDVEYSLNCWVGLFAFAISLIPPLALMAWGRIWRGNWRF